MINNKHWLSDALAGAGIGILCGELGYYLTDLIFKDRGLLREELPEPAYDLSHRPSFIGLYLGYNLFLNRTENNRDLAAFCQHVADNFFVADMQRLRPHDRQSVPVLMIFRHFSLLKTALKYGRKVAKLQIQNILTHALCPPKLKKNFLVR